MRRRTARFAPDLMNFRRQLVLSIGLLVLVPAVLATLAIGWVVTSNENAKADARLEAAVRVTGVLVGERSLRAERRVQDLEDDRELRAALDSGDRAAVRRALPRALERSDLLAGRVTLPGGEIVAAGPQDAVGVARATTQTDDGKEIEIAFGFSPPDELVDEVQRITGVPVRLVGPTGRSVASTANFPTPVQIDTTLRPPVTEGRWRTRQLGVPAVRGEELQAIAAGNPQRANATLSWGLVAGVLLAFMVIGLGLALVLVRALGSRVERFVTAAERVGGGDFAAVDEIPAGGGDEFGRLGRAFVEMAGELDQRIAQLAEERERVRSSLDRLGQAFAANLDRDQLVELVVDAVVSGTNASAGRALLPLGSTSKLEEHGATGSVPELHGALAAAEQACLSGGKPAVLELDGVHAIAEPLQAQTDGRIGAISVARDSPFDADERSMLRYLTRQAEVSLHNVGRHEDVARESITDNLTGLANRRRFDDVLSSVVSRAAEKAPVALVMIDLDHFKNINDTHGHPFGDQVLRAVGEVVRASTRERDLPARYGGEEMAVILAKGDVHAAKHFGERLRRSIEALQLGDPTTGPVPVTASIGVASLPADGDSAGDLVRAADEALYRAKRGGRNRVEASSPAQSAEGKVR